MDILVIEGGERLLGEVTISGAKNAALPILCACILASGPCHIEDIPNLKDTLTIKKLLMDLGLQFYDKNDHIIADPSNLSGYEASYELVKTMRASVLVLGPLVTKLGKAKVSLPGGCAIGARPINLHLAGLKAMGARIDLEHGYVLAEADRLHGCEFNFDTVTVTGTENIMMAATLAEGETVLYNAACEPEIVALADFLKSMGAQISGDGTEEIRIQGTPELGSGKIRIIPDRIEAGTYMAAAGLTQGNVLLKNCNISHMESVVSKLRRTGLIIEPEGEDVRVVGPREIRATDIKTQPYPGFATDMQAQFMSLMTLANGTSVISETVFENRFMHSLELQRMGADIRIEGHAAIVRGHPFLSGADVMATDLRASACLVLAGLAAMGETRVHRIYHLDRGYESLEKKFKGLGAKMRREKE